VPDSVEQIELTPRILRVAALMVFFGLGALSAVVGSAALGLLVPCLLLGALMASGFRNGIEVDRARGEVATWWGIGWRWVRNVRRLDDIEAVLISSELREQLRRSGLIRIYVVRLVGKQSPLLVRDAVEDSFQTAAMARPLAERIAALVGKPIREE
jgi:hypothetical protein